MANIFLQKLEVKGEAVALTVVERQRQADLQVRLKNLASKEDSVRYLADTLQRYVGARLLRPQRVLSISSEEDVRENAG